MNSHSQQVGRWGESHAVEYLIHSGYDILGRNIVTSYGEIDILAQQNETLIFIEVKTRSSDQFGFPEESITETKMNHMVESAQGYIIENYSNDPEWRIDVIAIQGDNKTDIPQIEHFENVSE